MATIITTIFSSRLHYSVYVNKLFGWSVALALDVSLWHARAPLRLVGERVGTICKNAPVSWKGRSNLHTAQLYLCKVIRHNWTFFWSSRNVCHQKWSTKFKSASLPHLKQIRLSESKLSGNGWNQSSITQNQEFVCSCHLFWLDDDMQLTKQLFCGKIGRVKEKI